MSEPQPLGKGERQPLLAPLPESERPGASNTEDPDADEVERAAILNSQPLTWSMITWRVILALFCAFLLSILIKYLVDSEDGDVSQHAEVLASWCRS
jgi:hypothetical protein